MPNAGQGNCLFEAIAQGVERAGGGSHHHRSVRAAAVAHLVKHKEKYYPFWYNRDPNDEVVADVSLAGFERYIQQVSEISQYAGNLEITALASTMDRPITVVQAEGPVHTFNSSGANRGTYLFFGNKHYELLEVSPEAKLALHTKAMPGKTGGGRESARGGGKASSPSRKNLGGHTAVAGGNKATSSADVAVLEDLDGLVDESQTTNLELSRYRTVQQVWVCPYCQQSFTKTGKSPLHRVRRNHLRGRHKEQKPNKSNWMREVVTTVVATPDLPEEARAWTCAFCDCSLPTLNKVAHDNAVTFHYQSKHPRRDRSLKAVHAARAKKNKKRQQLGLHRTDGKTGLGDKLRKYAADKLGDLDTGHNLVRVNVDPATWPQLLTAAKNGRQPTILTCVTCRRMFQGSGMAAVHKKCQPFPDVPL